MDKEQQTCGKGLAANSTLPAKLAELTIAVADILEFHMTALDVTDEHSKTEHAAYAKLVGEHREMALRLSAIANEMAGYRNLPMGPHDMSKMAGPAAAAVFERFVNLEVDLAAYLEKRLEDDGKMLAAIRGARS